MKWYRNIKISAKLILGFFVLAFISAVVGIVGLTNIYSIDTGSTILFEENTLAILYTGNASTSFQRLRYNALKLTTVDTAEDREECIVTINEQTSYIDEMLEKYTETFFEGEDLSVYNEVMKDWEQYKSKMKDVINYINIGQYQKAEDIILIECKKIGDEIRDGFLELMDSNTADADRRAEINNATTQTSALIMIGVIIAGVILAVVLGAYISRVISRPIRQIVAAADSIAMGNVDISVDVDTKDEIGELANSFRRMIENIRNQAFATQKVAAGDLTIDVPVNSEKDLLGNNLAGKHQSYIFYERGGAFPLFQGGRPAGIDRKGKRQRFTNLECRLLQR